MLNARGIISRFEGDFSSLPGARAQILHRQVGEYFELDVFWHVLDVLFGIFKRQLGRHVCFCCCCYGILLHRDHAACIRLAKLFHCVKALWCIYLCMHVDLCMYACMCAVWFVKERTGVFTRLVWPFFLSCPLLSINCCSKFVCYLIISGFSSSMFLAIVIYVFI